MDEVLYVDHSTTSQTLVGKYLDGIASLTFATSIDAAIQILGERRFKLMVAGYDFAEGNILEIIQHVRTSPVHGQMPVIIISSSLDETLLTRILRAGANDGMSKPLNVPVFQAMVARMLAEPYVRSLEYRVIDVACFQWRTNLGVCEFCPELNLTITGATREDVTNRMRAALQEHGYRDGVALGNTGNEVVVRHEVRLPGSRSVTAPPSMPVE
jgi:CheY-like chemotaxis protein